jgi:hypothetical protein
VARPSSTEVVLVGGVPDEVFGQLDSLPNVRAMSLATIRGDGDEPGPDARARSFAASVHAPYAVHDVDPLGDVGRSWVAYFDESAPVGTLEVAVEELIARLRRGVATLPDYFIVIEPESLPVTERHWWLGAVAAAAPSRIVPAPATASGIAHVLAALPSGRWWPDDHATWLRGLASVIPDRVGRV